MRMNGRKLPMPPCAQPPACGLCDGAVVVPGAGGVPGGGAAGAAAGGAAGAVAPSARTSVNGKSGATTGDLPKRFPVRKTVVVYPTPPAASTLNGGRGEEAAGEGVEGAVEDGGARGLHK